MTTTSMRSLAFTLTLLGVLANSAGAQDTLRVPQDFGTIQQAVDAASDGDTIRISKGIYPEFVEIIGLSNLSVIGRGKPVLLGGSLAMEGEEASGGLLLVNCSNVLVKGLIAREPVETNGFTVSSCSDVTLQLCRVERPMTDDGLGIFSSTDVTVDRFSMKGTPGSFSEEGSEPVGGINISSSERVTVTKARIQDTSDDGIHVASSSDVILQKCILKRIDDDGIHASSGVMGGALLVDRCKLSDIDDDGIQTSGSMTDLTVLKTVIKRVDDNGVTASGRAATLDRVSVTWAGDNGFKLYPIATAPPLSADGVVPLGPIRVTNCRASRVEDDGLDLEANGAVIDNLRVAQVEDDGIRISNSEGVEITKVRLSKVEGRGMAIFGVTNSTFTDFRMAKPSDGVYVDFASSGNTFQRWKIRAPDGDGFDLDGPNNTYLENTVTKAGGYGFSVITSGNTFSDNKAVKSGTADLQDTAGQGANTYTGNVFGTSEGP